jgi:DNA-binding HxlR family transcriptional regulator
MARVRPGRPVRGSRSGRPIMAVLDLLGRRWALRILWELREGALGFNELQTRCDAMSPSVLNLRLAELRDAGVLAANEARAYALTREGEALVEALGALDVWARRWAARSSRGAQPARSESTTTSSSSAAATSRRRATGGSHSPSPGSRRRRTSAAPRTSRR